MVRISVLLNSAPRYINAIEPGSHFSLALFTSMTVLHRRKPDEERTERERGERTEERKRAIRAKMSASLRLVSQTFYSRLTFLPFRGQDTTSSGKLLLLRWYSPIAEIQSAAFLSLFRSLFHYHQSELLRFPVSHLVGNYGGVTGGAVPGQVELWFRVSIGHSRRAYGGHFEERTNIHSDTDWDVLHKHTQASHNSLCLHSFLHS